MRSLKIPIFFQPINKPYCGPTCIKMILYYYGIRISLNNLVRLLPVTRAGIDMCSMGMFLRSLGLVTIFINKDSADAKNPAYKRTTPLFLKAGGLLIPRATRTVDIRKAIVGGCPVILNVENDDGGGHFVVVRRIGKKRITINDPARGLTTPSIKRVMSACHNWTGGAIIIRPHFKSRD